MSTIYLPGQFVMVRYAKQFGDDKPLTELAVVPDTSALSPFQHYVTGDGVLHTDGAYTEISPVNWLVKDRNVYVFRRFHLPNNDMYSRGNYITCFHLMCYALNDYPDAFVYNFNERGTIKRYGSHVTLCDTFVKIANLDRKLVG